MLLVAKWNIQPLPSDTCGSALTYIGQSCFAGIFQVDKSMLTSLGVRRVVCIGDRRRWAERWKRFPAEKMMINAQARSGRGVTGPRQRDREGECLRLDNKLLQVIYSVAGRAEGETVGFAVRLNVPMQWKGSALLHGEWITLVLRLPAD